MGRKVPFASGFEDVSIPVGKRVTNVSVIFNDGAEVVQISVEDIPVLPPEVLATVKVSR